MRYSKEEYEYRDNLINQIISLNIRMYPNRYIETNLGIAQKEALIDKSTEELENILESRFKLYLKKLLGNELPKNFNQQKIIPKINGRINLEFIKSYIEESNKWYKFLDVRKELHNAIEDLVENSKLYRDKNGL
jgi:hypothetical protein